jgi:hypothetical protein
LLGARCAYLKRDFQLCSVCRKLALAIPSPIFSRSREFHSSSENFLFPLKWEHIRFYVAPRRTAKFSVHSKSPSSHPHSSRNDLDTLSSLLKSWGTLYTSSSTNVHRLAPKISGSHVSGHRRAAPCHLGAYWLGDTSSRRPLRSLHVRKLASLRPRVSRAEQPTN